MSAPTSRDDGPAVTEHPEDTAPVKGAASLSEKSAHPASSAAVAATTTARRAPERARPVPSLMPPHYRSCRGRGSLPAVGAFAL